MYMRIRAFSMAKDVVQKHKIAKRDMGKVASLCKSLKISVDAKNWVIQCVNKHG